MVVCTVVIVTIVVAVDSVEAEIMSIAVLDTTAIFEVVPMVLNNM